MNLAWLLPPKQGHYLENLAWHEQLVLPSIESQHCFWNITTFFKNPDWTQNLGLWEKLRPKNLVIPSLSESYLLVLNQTISFKEKYINIKISHPDDKLKNLFTKTHHAVCTVCTYCEHFALLKSIPSTKGVLRNTILSFQFEPKHQAVSVMFQFVP
jgi:hypothetical protein